MDIYAIVSPQGGSWNWQASGLRSHPGKAHGRRATRPLSKASMLQESMSGVRTFFRHCPSCGRRFEIRLVKKEQVASEVLDEKLERPENPIIARGMTPIIPTGPAPTILGNDVPSIVDIEDFQYTYKCKHCGHEWSEVHEKEQTYRAPEGYTGD